MQSLKQTSLIPKLKFYGSDVEGELSDSVEYDGNELDNEGGDTTGKAARLLTCTKHDTIQQYDF